MMNETDFIRNYCWSLLEEEFKQICSEIAINNFLIKIFLVFMSVFILLIFYEILKNKKKEGGQMKFMES